MFIRKPISIEFSDGETEANTHTQPHPQHNSAHIQHVHSPLIPHQNVNLTDMLRTTSLLLRRSPQNLNALLHYRFYVWK